MIERIVPAVLCSVLLAQDSRPSGAPPYRHHDLTKAVSKKDAGGGKHTYQLDLAEITKAVDDLARNARNYPPQFRDAEDRAAAVKDVRSLSQLFAMITGAKETEPPAEVLLLAGRVESMGHNLDVEGSAGRATRYFERLLAREPEHAKANLHFGVFLAGTATGQRKGIPYLEKAVQLGEEEARYALGLAHLLLQDKAQALVHLREFAKRNPGHERTSRLIEAIENGTLEVNTSQPHTRPAATSRPARGAEDR